MKLPSDGRLVQLVQTADDAGASSPAHSRTSATATPEPPPLLPPPIPAGHTAHCEEFTPAAKPAAQATQTPTPADLPAGQPTQNDADALDTYRPRVGSRGPRQRSAERSAGRGTHRAGVALPAERLVAQRERIGRTGGAAIGEIVAECAVGARGAHRGVRKRR